VAGIQVGLNSLYYAILTSDTPSGAAYSAPAAIVRPARALTTG